MQPGKQLAMPMKFVPLMHQWAHLGRLVVIVSQSPQLGKTGRHDTSQSCEVTVIPISFISSLVKMTSFHLLIWGLFCFSSYGALRCIQVVYLQLLRFPDVGIQTTNSPLRIAFIISHRFCYIVFSFAFDSRSCGLYFLKFSRSPPLFNSVLAKLQEFVYLLGFLLLLIGRLIPL